MNYDEIKKGFENKISFDDLISGLLSKTFPTKYSGDEETLVVSRCLIKNDSDQTIAFEENVKIDTRIEFVSCFFDTSKLVFIMGMECRQSVTFKSCYFPGGLFIHSGTFKKELNLLSIHAPEIQFFCGKFERIKINLFGGDVKKIWISGGEFKELQIFNSEPKIENDPIALTIINSNSDPNEKLGDILISKLKISELYIGGTNFSHVYTFGAIECNRVHISNFNNSGTLNFYGLQSYNANGTDCYFQITGSTLEKAKFYKTKFSSYQELIIINSYIIDCTFLECQWSDNIRSLQGPGYSDFQKSLDSGRKIEPEEMRSIKDVYRQLKISMNKHNDKVQEHIFYSKEMNAYNEILPWSAPWEHTFWDKLILHSSRIFSDYGQSFIRPFLWLLLGHFLLFTLTILFNGFSPLHISINDPTSEGFKTAFEKYFIYINPLRKAENTLSGYLIFVDILMRIWASFMIFNIIRATRRFIS